MENKTAHEAPATFGDAFSKGLQIGLELNEARKQMRETIAHRAKVCRMAKKMTQEDVAKAIDINYLTYRGYENCKSDIPIVYLIRIADLFKVSLDYLTGRTDEPSGLNEQDTERRLAQLEKTIEQLMQQRENEK